MARSATGVVRVAAIPLLIWLFRDRPNHPAVACGRGFPSLSKEGSLSAEFRDRNQLEPWTSRFEESSGCSYQEPRKYSRHYDRMSISTIQSPSG